MSGVPLSKAPTIVDILARLRALESGGGVAGVSSFNSRTGAVTLISADVDPVLVAVNPSPGGYGSATSIPVLTVDAKGRVTAITQVAAAGGGSAGVSSFNTRTGAVTLTSNDVTTALGYTPTSITGFTGAQTPAAVKTALALTKADVGLGNADNTADANKNVLTATKWFASRNLSLTGDATATLAVDGSANASAALTLATVNSNVGTFGSGQNVATFTVDGKGRTTAAGEAPITFPWALNFTANGDAYIPARVAQTIAQGNAPLGTGAVTYAKSTAAAPSTFTTTTLPASLEAGAWLRVTASGVSGFYALNLYRSG